MLDMLRPSILLAFLAVVTLPALDTWAEPPVPVVESISVSSGPVSGGTRVVIQGRNFDGGTCQRELGCALRVGFFTPHREPCCLTGVAKIISASDTRIEIETPEHGNGLVDLIVSNKAGGEAVVKNAFRFGRGGYHRVLLPVGFHGVVEGAFGSRWVTEVTGRVFNRDSAVEVTRTPFSNPPHLALGSFVFEDLPTGTSGGTFIYVEDDRDFVDLALRFRDISRQKENFGTEVPVVTAADTTAMFGFGLLDIPVGPGYRSTLRLYNFEGRRPLVVTVRILARESMDELLVQTYHMHNGDSTRPVEEFPSLPGYVQLNLDDLLPDGYIGRVDVSIGHHPGPRIWGMVSITNNDTQMVTMVTPTFLERGGLSWVPRW
jgi:hypothetical protein